MTADSDIIKSGLSEVVSILAETGTNTLNNGSTSYPIEVVANSLIAQEQQNDSNRVWQKSKRFTIIVPTNVNKHNIGKGWFINHESLKWDIIEIGNGYGNVLEVLAVLDTVKSFKNGIDRKGR